MSLSHAINAAKSGLQVSGLRADIVANNVANATTPGYVRRSVMLSETIVGQRSAGVHSTGIARSADSALTSQRMMLSSDLSQANVLASTWQTLSARLGDTADGAGLFSKLSQFEEALQTAATSPESKTNANAVLDAARAITTELNSLSALVATQRSEADREIADGVNVVNDALKKIETLNGQLSSMDRTTPQAAGLMDERQRTLDTIAEYLPVQAVPRQAGTIDLVTKEGVYLLQGKARQIEFTPSSAFGPNQTVGNGALSGMSVDGIDITPGAFSFGAVSSGLFGALFTLRDGDLPDFGRQLDTVAEDLITRLSDDTIDPTKMPGDPGLFVDTNPGGGDGLAGRIDLNALVDPTQGGEIWRLRDGLGATAEGPPGNTSILTAMLGSITDTRAINANGFQGSFTASELTATFASRTGQARISNEAVLSSTNAQHNLVAEAEQDKTGVDVDSEMQALLLIEQAYAANARVIETANQMVQRLMEI
ncbi:flagellar hook-associated protein FlgK [Henriciella aquimarina]|uniref:flagellar hook-associated protein FlgK n=1 Tax=Henriciella aquimarina TaxID=545261 RepID=UPI0009FFF2A2|nr:flagellar hook-associated protein FlgK [Henriciella aquimarina]